MNKIPLNVLGLSYSQTQTGAYALVLSEENGERRIPIIIGAFEAQSIAIELEGLKPPRPLTHDLLVNFAMAFNIELIEVNIYKLEEGIFYAELVCDKGGSRIKIDARTSDAVALAIRFKCPIYTNEDILNKAGIVLDFNKEAGETKSTPQYKKSKTERKKKKDINKPSEFEYLTLDELKQLLDEAVSEENYEKASLLRDEISRRENK